jgi:hypothetical protein
MHDESHETLTSLMTRFHALKAKMDVIHQAWRVAVHEHDFAKEVRLIAYEQTLILKTSAVMSAFHRLIAKKLQGDR